MSRWTAEKDVLQSLSSGPTGIRERKKRCEEMYTFQRRRHVSGSLYWRSVHSYYFWLPAAAIQAVQALGRQARLQQLPALKVKVLLQRAVGMADTATGVRHRQLAVLAISSTRQRRR